MATSGNVTKYVILHQYEQYIQCEDLEFIIQAFLSNSPESVCIPFKLMCPLNRQSKWKPQIFDLIALANAISSIVVNWYTTRIQVHI